MDKTTLLKELEQKLKSQEISGADLERLAESVAQSPAASTRTNPEVSSILYYIGGGIVFLGIAIMVGTNWNYISTPIKLLLTLGMGLITYMLGLYMHTKKDLGHLPDAMFLITGLIFPFGLFVLFKDYGIISDVNTVNLVMSLMLSLLFGISLISIKRIIFLGAFIVSATWVFVSLVNIIQGISFVSVESVEQYSAIAIGISFVTLAQALKDTKWKGLTFPLSLVGLPIMLLPLVTLGGKIGFEVQPKSFSWIWDLIYVPVIFGVLLLSVPLKERVYLWWGTIFLIGFIFKITGVYFAEQLTWPVALIIAGVALIGVGYYVFYLNNRIKSEK